MREWQIIYIITLLIINKYLYNMIYLEAFDPFKTKPNNVDLVERGVYGVMVWIKDEWVPTEITEDDFYKYEHIIMDEKNPDYEKLQANLYEVNVSGAYKGWPLVSLYKNL